MVQLKYFGDSRDHFKYDLITEILRRSSLRCYVFIPMLTWHRADNEGRIRPKPRGDGLPDDLYDFIIQCDGKSLDHWREWITRHGITYETVEPVHETLFTDVNRDAYWELFRPLIGSDRTLIFVDPDTGLQTGSPGYLRRKGREKYIFEREVAWLVREMSDSSALMLYQHLTRNKHNQHASVEGKLAQIRRLNNSARVCAYREDDLVFLFVCRQSGLCAEILRLLEDYHGKRNHRYKSLHNGRE